MRALQPRSAPAADRGAPTLSRHGAPLRVANRTYFCRNWKQIGQHPR
jgi:hypothetical protein